MLQCLVDLLCQQLYTLVEAVRTESTVDGENGNSEEYKKKTESEEGEEGNKEDGEGMTTNLCHVSCVFFVSIPT